MVRAGSISLILYCLTIGLSSAQDRYMVFFTDKSGTTFSTSNPQQFLSSRAIARRQRQQIAIAENDLPVNQTYVEALETLGAETYFTTKWMNGVLIQAEPGLIGAIEALSFVDRTEYVGPDAPLSADGSDSDGAESAQGAESTQSDFQNDMIGISAMHQAGFEGQGMLIAVFDEGFNNLSSIPAFDHLFQENRILYTHDFTINRSNVENNVTHGRRVLSVLAARSEELTGTAPEASFILSITEASGEYRVEEYNWLFAAEKADSAGVDIINTSLGYNLFLDPSMDYSLSDMDGRTTVITRATNIAASKGIALVTSAGNTGQSQLWPIITAPGDSPHNLAVGSVNAALQKARISSVGPSADNRVKPDVAALGVSTAVTGTDGSVTFSDGTSFASPLIAGLMAGVWQVYPDLTANELLNLIRLSGSQYNNPDNQIGFGIPNFITTVQIAGEIGLPVVEDLTVYPNPVSDSFVNLAFDTSFFNREVRVELVRTNGQVINEYNFIPTERDNRIQIGLGDNPPGLYLLKVVGQGGSFAKKLIRL
ncbi:MAG: S8 family serine peptidase [Roseivirga sp.]|nr:S8 family serine peptidase [Roseivirga sp.]